MDIKTLNTIIYAGPLIYAGIALVVAIMTATIVRVKGVDFGILDSLICVLFGVIWPLTISIEIVYLASGFIYGRFFKAKER